MLRPSLADPERSASDESGDDSVEPNLRRARQLRLEGSYEEAAALYRSVLETGRRDADAIALAAAESSLAAGDYVPAVAMANRALELNSERLEANVVKAEALRGLGLTSDARGVFEEAVDDPLIGGYAAFRAAELAEAAGDRAAARQLFAQAIDLGLDSWWETIAARRIGKDYLASGDSSSAVSWLTHATNAALVTERRGSPVWFHGELVRRNSEARRAPILLELARAQLQAGARDGAIETYVTTTAGYPNTTEGRDALGALTDLGATGRLTPYQRGLVLFNASRDREAIAVLSSAGGPEAAAAWYYLGLAQRDVGNRPDAVAELTEMARAYPADRLAPEALWQAARMLDTSGNRSDAIEAYFSVADAFPNSDQAARALLRIGWLNVAMGDGSAARAAWQRLGSFHPDPQARAQGLFWLGRSLLGIGATTDGKTQLDEAARIAPFSFEGIRSRDLAAGGRGAEPFSRMWGESFSMPPVDDAAACADWITTWSSEPTSPELNAQLARLDRLLAVGMRGPAVAVGLQAATPGMLPSIDLYKLSAALNARGLFAPSIHVALRLGQASPSGRAEETPACVQRLVYPLVFPHLVEAEAGKYGLDPLYLTALMRQESWFESHALSSAQARGMSQVIPDTRRSIARAVGRPEVTDDDLYRPREAIAFGAYYLNETYRSLGGRPLLALAAYNAGPGNARRWSAGNPSRDADDYVEAIDFNETRNYVRSIYPMFERYRSLYAMPPG